ncbi:Acetamidase/formamidase [Jatrophihabitans endophyticus]|uniref:Acetamidase/formamidase n=1 Tax=Jatrophihabitans endophyticus TaxID=1206085 RepID=A0A1M5DPC0_9ACTN|nr:acetamidase/formamidase family protein [Jatrophihabitans endophyticus]SHF68837.1 Acetamidase/formamidase [Jatrophihabitans endophyticus]
MTHHRLEPSVDTVSDVLTRGRPPVLSMQPGDRLTVRTLDCAGNLDRGPAVAAGGGRRLLPGARGHCLAGPVAVVGARPGQTLAVGIEALTPDRWGFTRAGGHDTLLHRRLGTAALDPAQLSWDIDDVAGGVAVNQYGVAVDVRPFLGVIGLPPDADGEHSTIPPRAAGAGNVDCAELVAGSTLFVPVTVPDAYLYLGDGHAAQGDGEVGGTAIETGMTTTVTLDLIDDPPVAGVHAVTPAGLITFGFDADLNAATADALAAMLDWLERLTGLARPVVLALASTCVDLRITQIANRTWGVHAVLPHRVREQLRR